MGDSTDSPSPDCMPGGWGDFFASGAASLPAWTPAVARMRGEECVRVTARDVYGLLDQLGASSAELDIIAVNKVGLQLMIFWLHVRVI